MLRNINIISIDIVPFDKLQRMFVYMSGCLELFGHPSYTFNTEMSIQTPSIWTGGCE